MPTLLSLLFVALISFLFPYPLSVLPTALALALVLDLAEGKPS